MVKGLLVLFPSTGEVRTVVGSSIEQDDDEGEDADATDPLEEIDDGLDAERSEGGDAASLGLLAPLVVTPATALKPPSGAWVLQLDAGLQHTLFRR